MENVLKMKQNRKGTIAITGATSSLRARKETAAFSPAKAAQRMLAQSLNKSLAPYNVNVFMVIIDGAIDTEKNRNWEKFKNMPKDCFIQPDGVADVFWNMASQGGSCRSFEIEVTASGQEYGERLN